MLEYSQWYILNKTYKFETRYSDTAFSNSDQLTTGQKFLISILDDLVIKKTPYGL